MRRRADSIRRSAANLLAVSERQRVETLRRDEKTQSDALASVEDKIGQAERQASNPRVDQYSERQIEVRKRQNTHQLIGRCNLMSPRCEMTETASRTSSIRRWLSDSASSESSMLLPPADFAKASKRQNSTTSFKTSTTSSFRPVRTKGRAREKPRCEKLSAISSASFLVGLLLPTAADSSRCPWPAHRFV